MPIRSHILLLLCLLCGAALVTPPAKADCISACMAGKDCSLNYSGACSNALSDCSQECMAANQGPSYGAIAYDYDSRAFGYAYQFPSEGQAADFALQSCAENGDACKVVVTFNDSCAALASGLKDDRRISFTVISGDKDYAQSKSVANCSADGAAACELEVWSCSF